MGKKERDNLAKEIKISLSNLDKKEKDEYFPNLQDGLFTYESRATKRYNCVAWSIAKTWWWISHKRKWPRKIKSTPFLYSYVKYFESLEFKRCESGEYEEGIEKIAIYYSSGDIFKHVAFRLDRDRWASKLGGWEDIYHKNVNCLAGGKYGIYIIYMKRELTWLRKLKRQVALSSTKILSMKS